MLRLRQTEKVRNDEVFGRIRITKEIATCNQKKTTESLGGNNEESRLGDFNIPNAQENQKETESNLVRINGRQNKYNTDKRILLKRQMQLSDIKQQRAIVSHALKGYGT